MAVAKAKAPALKRETGKDKPARYNLNLRADYGELMALRREFNKRHDYAESWQKWLKRRLMRGLELGG